MRETREYPRHATEMFELGREWLLLRSWVLITGLAGLGAASGAYRHPLSPHSTLYRLSTNTACAEFARMYATWLLLSTIVRIAFFVDPVNTTLFWVTFGTYGIALWHFILEIFVYRVAALKPAGVAPIIVASASVVWFLSIAFIRL